MEAEGMLLGAVAVASLAAAWQAWREREHRYDVALLAATGVGLGALAGAV